MNEPRVSLRRLGLGAVIFGIAIAVAVPGARHRLELIALRLFGKIPDLAWSDVFRMMPPRSGYDLAPLVASRNPNNTIVNPWPGEESAELGREVFRRDCASCHGTDAHGDTGPDLTRSDLSRSNTDWGLFRTIRVGIPGTAMPPSGLGHRDAWRVVAYLRMRRAEVQLGAGRQAASGKRVPVTLPEIAFQDLVRAGERPGDWLTYSGTLNGQRHSTLAEVNSRNIGQLGLAWAFQMSSPEEEIETSPLVIRETMYLTSPPSQVWALDARTGDTLWTYRHEMVSLPPLCCGQRNRGLAVLGNTLFLGALNSELVALNARDGSVKWKVPVADPTQGYSITGAPLALDGIVIVGVGGGEYGIRGFLDGYDAETGKRRWRFHTVPGPGEPGHETWGGGDAWKRGSAPTWLTGSYDPDLQLLYWGVGNPGPDYQGDVRPGDNLYSNSVIALDPRTGTLRWHFQFTPHDDHDWDASQIPVLADRMIGGRVRKLLLWANRNGFYYVLDRETGAFLTGRPFVRQTWAKGLDSTGRPILVPGMSPSVKGTVVYPGVTGGTNWWSPSYDHKLGLFFVPTMEQGSVFFQNPGHFGRAPRYTGSMNDPVRDPAGFKTVRALDAITGELRWEFASPPPPERHGMGGLLSTDGGVVFGGIGNQFFALDAATGRELWKLNVGGPVRAAPITYQVGGRQYVSIAAGRSLLTFTLKR